MRWKVCFLRDLLLSSPESDDMSADWEKIWKICRQDGLVVRGLGFRWKIGFGHSRVLIREYRSHQTILQPVRSARARVEDMTVFEGGWQRWCVNDGAEMHMGGA